MCPASSQTPSRPSIPPRAPCAPPARRIVPSTGSATRHGIPVSPALRDAGRAAKPPLHFLRRDNVVASAAKRGPDARQKVVQVGGDQARALRLGLAGPVDDKRHEEHGPGQVLCVKVYDEEVDLACGVVLGVRVGVGERQGGEEDEAVEQATRDSLSVVSDKTDKAATQRQYVGSQHRLAKYVFAKLSQVAIPPCPHTHSPFYIMRMTGLRNVQGYSSSVPGTASAIESGWAGR